jgi:hypothetical protein
MNNKQNWKKNLGRRVLVRENYYSRLQEVKIIEVSDRAVKLEWESGNKVWVEFGDYNIFEVLPYEDVVADMINTFKPSYRELLEEFECITK